MDTLEKLYNKGVSRRNFMAGAGALGAASVLAGCSDSGSVAAPVTSSTYTDLDVLNFALNLEYLEAQFYLYAATGKGLATADTVAPSGYTGKYTVGTVTVGNAGLVAGTTAQQQQIISEIAYEEQEHVRFLRAALGSAAVPMPSIDLSFFAPLATAAGITGGSTFSPFASFDAFLIGAFIFEDVGVTAYAGAAPLISAAGVTAGYLNAAAGILAVEAYHAGYVRTALTGRAIAAGATTPTSTAYPYVGIANQVAALRATLTVGNSGAGSTGTGNTGAAGSSTSVETLLTVPTSVTTPSAIVAADSTSAIGFARNVNQVHHIVYGSATVGVAKGGFFPNGTNSIFATTTA
ncbi:Tat (twin-arginine translocation) pathway signal sequence [Granulicella rosea]|uniref:Tat (Twin-arginine translocation) pathway signal sequence n=1 Tax=Granulicella rosea TaxID=474952 RepID=A0A239J4C9_9BACT|nr:ferritin-like domain-containing protein [Granulicella rosea]SNT00680.1 Tat (twin-arginine translocation) pathway signal sequence [Granulicella rosea]